MVKILLVGSDQVWSLERFYVKYFVRSHASVELFAAQNMFYDYHGQSILNKIRIRAGISKIYQSINASLRARIEKFQPQIVWVFKGMELLPATLEWIRSRGILLVNYNPDNPFIFSGSGSGNKYVRESISLYDLHFTYNLEIKKRLEDEFDLLTSFLPFAFELDEETYLQNREEPEILRACFLGNPDGQRSKFIKELVAANLPLDLYGNDWERFLGTAPNLRIFPAVYGNDFWKTLYKYRLQLNIMRVHNEDSHNMRTFEIPGAGGIMLAPSTTEHRLFFDDGKEVFLFTNAEDCLEKARKILALDTTRAGQIRTSARRRSIDSHYTYEDRAREALRTMSGML